MFFSAASIICTINAKFECLSINLIEFLFVFLRSFVWISIQNTLNYYNTRLFFGKQKETFFKRLSKVVICTELFDDSLHFHLNFKSPLIVSEIVHSNASVLLNFLVYYKIQISILIGFKLHAPTDNCPIAVC